MTAETAKILTKQAEELKQVIQESANLEYPTSQSPQIGPECPISQLLGCPPLDIVFKRKL